MREQFITIDKEPNPNKEPKKYVVLELDSNTFYLNPLFLGRRDEKNKWIPSIDLPNHLGETEEKGKESCSPRHLQINVREQTITLESSTSGKTYFNGKLLENGASLPFKDGDIINIDQIQLFLQKVSTTNTGKPYYLYEIDVQKHYSRKPKTPWNQNGYLPTDHAFVEELQKDFPLWLIIAAQEGAKTWELNFLHLLQIFEAGIHKARKKETDRHHLTKPTGGFDKNLVIYSLLEEKRKKKKQEWIKYHQTRQPIYHPTEEKGKFVGIFGYRTGSGARELPYYLTESGIYFYEADDKDTGNTIVAELDYSIMIQNNGLPLLFSAESWLAGKPLDKQNLRNGN